MAVCGKCAAPVIVGRVAETDEVKGFDVHELSYGPGRYVRGEDGLYRPCREAWAEPAFVDHVTSCAANHRAP